MSEQAHPESYNEDSLQIISAIYWDVNCVCHFQNIVADKPSQEDITSYGNMKMRAETFVNKTVIEYLTSQENDGLLTRCAQFINETSWKMFAICAHSEAFQVASGNLKEENWLGLKELIKRNSRSLEVFARSRKLEWRGCLLVYSHYNLPGLEAELTPDINIAQEHPHHTVLLEDGHLRRPVFQGAAQTNIASSFWNPLDFPFRSYTENPSARTPGMGKCSFCGDPNNCQCTIKSQAGDLVELFEYSGKGIGIRSLSYFKKGEWIAEYTGVLAPVSPFGGRTIDLNKTFEAFELVKPAPITRWPAKLIEAVYGLTQVAQDSKTGKWYSPASIFPHQFGNWTRFINHSCQPNVNFYYLVLGDRVITVIYAAQDVSIFEEITVDYGEGYWRSRPHLSCHCGHPNCYQPAAKPFYPHDM